MGLLCPTVIGKKVWPKGNLMEKIQSAAYEKENSLKITNKNVWIQKSLQKSLK